MRALPTNSASWSPLMKNSTFSSLARLFCTILLSPQNYIKSISARPRVSERTAGTEKGSAAWRELWDFTQDLPSPTSFVLEGKKEYISVKHPGNNKKAKASTDYTTHVCYSGQRTTSEDVNRCGVENGGAIVTVSSSPRRPIQIASPLFGLFSSLDC